MGRSRRPVTYIKRQSGSDKPTWYYRFLDADGRRKTRSTGQTSRAAAETFVAQLQREDRLQQPVDITFARYAEPWWLWDACLYIRAKRIRGSRMSPNHVENQRQLLEARILPCFGRHRLRSITPAMVENWILELRETSGLASGTLNRALNCLKVMFKEAVKRGLLTASPAQYVSRLPETPKIRGIPSVDEVQSLFEEERIGELWDGDRRHYSLNMLAASSGMRLGEILAIENQHVHDGHIDVVQAWAQGQGFSDPKWGSQRPVPIPARTQEWLRKLMDLSLFPEPDSLVFFGIERRRPIDHRTVSDCLYAALGEIGIADADRRRRNITFHSWRHWFNTQMRTKVSDVKLRRVTGHRTVQMTELYTHFAREDFADVVDAQELLLGATRL
jgi:site-specific recombinase XerC